MNTDETTHYTFDVTDETTVNEIPVTVVHRVHDISPSQISVHDVSFALLFQCHHGLYDKICKFYMYFLCSPRRMLISGVFKTRKSVITSLRQKSDILPLSLIHI